MNMHVFILCLVLSVVSAQMLTGNESLPKDQKSREEHTLTEASEDNLKSAQSFGRNKGAGTVKPDIDERTGRIFFAFYSQTSVTILVTTTKVALSTCISTTAATCIGRKKKKSIHIDFPEMEEEPTPLDPGFSSADRLTEAPKTRTDKKLTLWSTSYSTLTITTTSFLTGTTATVSAMCTIPGVLTANTCVG